MSNTNVELLYGKSLSVLIAQAITSLKDKATEKILISSVVNEILLNRPELKIHITNSEDKKLLTKRVVCSVNKLEQSGLIDIERKKTIDLNINYIIITPKSL